MINTNRWEILSNKKQKPQSNKKETGMQKAEPLIINHLSLL
jgi:hypothetical protein